MSVFSPSFPPKGGMQLPRPNTHHGAPCACPSEDTSCCHKSLTNGDVLHALEEEDDHLDSRESLRKNSRGYPDGPIRIYDSGVFLYLEPTKDEASAFDVVVNVAKEIPNPFTNTCPENGTVVDAWQDVLGSKRLSCAEPLTAISDASFKSAWEYQPDSSTSTQSPGQSGPEYIHVGWDHNSEILEDLYPLCEFIDSRVASGKRVLVHCQLGVSRSASLLIAYGLYKHRNLDFNSMYGIVKERSHWVGPNMSLIYQLTEFRSRLQRGELEKSAPKDFLVSGPRRSSAPQPPSAQSDPRTSATPKRPGVKQNPSSASLPRESRGTVSGGTSTLPASPKPRVPPPRPLPLRASFYSLRPSDKRPIGLDSALQRPRTVADSPVSQEVTLPDVPPDLSSIFSPRTSQFMPSPLSRSIAGDLNGTVDPKSLEYGERPMDPRSPPQGNGRLIMRNIDEVL